MNSMTIERTGEGQWCIELARFTENDALSDQPTIRVEIFDSFARLAGLYVPVALRGNGFARRLVMLALDFAHEKAAGLPLFVDALPFGDRPVPQARLFLFYQGFGFRLQAHHPYSLRRPYEAPDWRQMAMTGGANG